MRNLASIQTIKEVVNIDGADAIQLATVLGWKCIVKKDEFKVGDKCVYVEIDSILPEKPEFEFLRPKKFRIKTMKLNKFGVISQGIIFPISILPSASYSVGQDVTVLINVTKYDPDAEKTADEIFNEEFNKKKRSKTLKFLMGYSVFRKIYMKFFMNKRDKKTFPAFISKTDETRIQNLSNKFEKEWSETGGWDVTEKVEGQSATYFSRKATEKVGLFRRKKTREFGVCSREVWLKTKHPCNWWNIAIKNNIEEKLAKVPFDVAIQGESAGPGIQGNIYKFPELRFFVFNVKNLETGEMYNYEQITAFCMYYGFEQVPLVARNFYLPKTLDEVVDYSNGKSLLYDTLREGVVIRKNDISFKAVSPEYLLKHGK